MNVINNSLEKGKPFSIVLLRTVVASRLVLGTWPYVIHKSSIREVIDFFHSLNLPIPVVSAYTSIYAQFVCGLLLLVGLYTQQAAFILFINFTVAILAAHLSDSIEKSFQAWALWACSIYFLFHGAGLYSVDWLADKRNSSS